tara:strand:- start:98 stop:478 length:381 start_codon:yes stop_codon:yes gene_type:complete
MANLMIECYEYTQKLNIITILKGLRISAKQIEINQYNGHYFLININIKAKVVNIITFKRSEFERATNEYLELEKEIKENESAVVLVSSSSIIGLKKAYPSYFLDTSEFISALEKMNKNCKKMNLVK